ncbi:DNA-binding CsgD family transcriptional regulator [Streptococcus rupicaprae]|uniref:DNA-binding CsgD family transcriptional regulator n=1 Tax=Streptococcus rupicaprae TaxID=759619 RepID=A0ABV2FGI2_9STRE
MRLIYEPYRSEIVEQLFLSAFVEKPDRDSFQGVKNDSLLRESFRVLEQLSELFLPYRSSIAELYLEANGVTLLQVCYFYLREQGQDPKTIQETHQLIASLEQEAIVICLKRLLETAENPWKEGLDFWEFVEGSLLPPAAKWQFMRFYQHPKEQMTKLLKLSEELIALYQPFLINSRSERRVASHRFSPFYKMDLFEAVVGERDVELILLSSWLMRSYLISFGEQTYSLYESCHSESLLANSQEMDDDTLVGILKVLSDLSRYQVLIEMTKKGAKTKEIAKRLNISGPAVSFHTQKLQTAQLLLDNVTDKGIKYDLNKDLLEEFIAKLVEDFGLDLP